MKKYIFIVMLGFSAIVFSQKTDDYNVQTLSLYIKEDWETLIIIAEEALEKNATSYNIDYRLAIAYYNTKNYFDSAQQFEFIIKNYQTKDETILEYLYYSYLFSGRQQDALLISKDFPFHIQEKTDVKSFKFIDVISAEGGMKMSNKENLGIENLSYLNGGFAQQFGYRVKLNHAFTTLSQNYIDFDYTQKEYYGNINIQVAKGLTLIPAFHYINTIENNQITRRRYGSGIISERTNIKTQLFHFAIKKQWNRFHITPNFIYYSLKNSDLGTLTKIQYGLNIGHTLKSTHDKLWVGAGGEFISTSTENKFIWNTKALYYISPKTYLYIKYIKANTSDFAIDNAMYYYNSASVLVDNFSATFGYYFTPKFSWYLNYQFENAKDLDYNLPFTYNTIITGININL
ncbi:MAG: hypothetical protein ABFR32_00535 [Bacteroidota bacterium]